MGGAVGVEQVVQWVFDVGRGGGVGVGWLDDWEIFVIGVGCANRHFILWRICGKSPDGANADEACLLAKCFKWS